MTRLLEQARIAEAWEKHIEAQAVLIWNRGGVDMATAKRQARRAASHVDAPVNNRECACPPEDGHDH